MRSQNNLFKSKYIQVVFQENCLKKLTTDIGRRFFRSDSYLKQKKQVHLKMYLHSVKKKIINSNTTNDLEKSLLQSIMRPSG